MEAIIIRMATFILLSAIPGSGKSTWAHRYQKEHPHTHIVSSDEIRKRLTGEVANFSKETEVWKTFIDTINNYGAKEDDCTVIADSTNLTNYYRKFYHDATPIFKKHVLVVFNIPYDICLKQNTMREAEKIVPVAAMERLKSQFEPPNEEITSLYDEYLVVSRSFVSKEVAAEEAAKETKPEDK